MSDLYPIVQLPRHLIFKRHISVSKVPLKVLLNPLCSKTNKQNRDQHSMGISVSVKADWTNHPLSVFFKLNLKQCCKPYLPVLCDQNLQGSQFISSKQKYIQFTMPLRGLVPCQIMACWLCENVFKRSFEMNVDTCCHRFRKFISMILLQSRQHFCLGCVVQFVETEDEHIVMTFVSEIHDGHCQTNGLFSI